jgi:hypothetical protein
MTIDLIAVFSITAIMCALSSAVLNAILRYKLTSKNKSYSNTQRPIFEMFLDGPFVTPLDREIGVLERRVLVARRVIMLLGIFSVIVAAIMQVEAGPDGMVFRVTF